MSKSKNSKNNKKIVFGITILAIAILITSSIFAYYEFFSGDKKAQIEEEETFQIDDRISPLENQGLICEILRIRHRGLYDKLMTPGLSWKKEPTFWFVLDIDELTYVSKNVEHLGKVVEIPFNTWDTMFQENKIIKDVEEEQETSEVTITLVERVKTGLLGLRTKDIERDKIQLKYDYRTGRWSGDDYFKDRDGYGHYLGETFEIWFNLYQVDRDLDYIPYWTEVNILGTNPKRDDSNKDPDGDGIPTAWEWKWDYDPFTWDDHEELDPDIDGLENIEEYQTARWLADPYSQDIYIEVDYMGRGGLLDPPHILYEETQQAIIEKYAEHNIKMYFDQGWPDTPQNGGGEELPHYEQISQDSGMILQFYNHHFPDERKGIFRYVVMGHAGPFNHPSKSNVYDSIHIAYSVEPINRLKSLFIWKIPPTGRGIRIKVGSTLMHELGHSVGIHPWTFEGCDNLSYNDGKAARKRYDETWGNYWSVMNYYHMYKTKLLDYSDGSNGPPYDQNDWEKLFVPTFQYNSELIEEPYFEPPGFDKIVINETKFEVAGYVYEEELTEKFSAEIGTQSPVEPIKVEWMVYRLKEGVDYPSDNNLKVYARPITPSTDWILAQEGFVDSDGSIQFYSLDDVIEERMP